MVSTSRDISHHEQTKDDLVGVLLIGETFHLAIWICNTLPGPTVAH